MSGQTNMQPPRADPPQPRVAFMQGGSRLRYAIPIALQRAGVLERMFTDWYVPSPRSPEAWLGRLVARFQPALGRRMLSRTSDELNNDRVIAHRASILRDAWAQRRCKSPTAFYRWQARANARWALRRGLGESNIVHGFVRNIHPQLLEEARRGGRVTLADQVIAPVAIEAREARIQEQRFGHWQPPGDRAGEQVTCALEQATWAATDHLTCASPYVRDGLIAQGVAADRVTVLPYPVDAQAFSWVDRTGRGGPVTVGFVGAVSLRKGAPYFCQVARRLAGPNLRFSMVGPIRLNDAVVQEHRPWVEFAGAVPLSEVARQLERFDMILFPSTCEGSAGALVEAMATGLPVVCSPNSGSVARDEREGFIRPYDDVDGLAAAVEQLVADPDQRRAMGRAARERVEALSIDHYARQITQLMQRLLAACDRSPQTESHH